MSTSSTHHLENSMTPDETPIERLDSENILDVNERLTPVWKGVVIFLSLAGIFLAVNQVFFLELFGISLVTNAFLYLLGACFLPIVIIVRPARNPKQKGTEATGATKVPFYDILLILILVATSGYFAYFGERITAYGWNYAAPTTAVVLSFVYWLLVLEVLRRSAGWIIAVISLVISLYPVVAGAMPIGFIKGISYDLDLLAQNHVMGSDSILGMPMQTVGSILVGFMLFGVVLQHTGGATFFHDLSNAIFGRFRGGTAKVSVASSAAMGMMSGSAISNVLTTGPLTIPAMIKAGFSKRVAGAVEATASSGGSITPPIMGTAAFLMVTFVGVPYTEIIVAAIIPAFLYFFGIFLQIDGYSAIRGMKGGRKGAGPNVWKTLASGWPYVLALMLLVGLLFVLGSEAQVPYFVVALLLVIAVVRPSIKFGKQEWVEMLLDVGKTLGQIVGIIAGVGLILGGLTATGVALSLSRDLVALVGENVILILIAGAIACFILGMGLTISAAYIFLAIVMAPAIIALGVDPIAAHLFVIYWASVSYITPPVGLAAFAAAGISKASPMATSFESMRLGAVKYIVPFGFALNPALVAQGPTQGIFIAAGSALIGTAALAVAFSSWFIFVEVKANIVQRALLAVGGFMMFLPQPGVTLTGLGVIVVVAIWALIAKKAKGSVITQEPATAVQAG